MPEHENEVPLFAGKVPGKCHCSTKKITEETDIVPNTAVPDIDRFVREHIRGIMGFIREKCDEKNITGDELMNITKIAHTSFYRLWKFGKPDEDLAEEDREWMKNYKPNADHVCRICLAVGVSLDEFQRAPTAESVINLPALSELSHEKIMNNMWEEISGLRDTISILERDNAQLTEKNEELTKKVFDRENDIRSNIERINKLTDALIDRHDQMHELNRAHNERVDRLDSALRDRYDQLYELFNKVIRNDPQKLMDLLRTNGNEKL